MILYAIREKSTGRHFVHTYWSGKAVWSRSPVFFKTPDAIWKNLKRLCSEFYYEEYQRGAGRHWTCFRKNWKGFKKANLKKYEVVQFSVKALGTKTVPASKFVVAKDIEKMNVRIR